MPNWTKVRANLDPQAGSGFVYLDMPAQSGGGSGDADWTVVPDADFIDNTQTMGALLTRRAYQSPLVPLKYRKTADGVVYVTGSIYLEPSIWMPWETVQLPSGSDWANCNGTGRFDLFTFPSGYRPLDPAWTWSATRPSWSMPEQNVAVTGYGQSMILEISSDGTLAYRACYLHRADHYTIDFSFYAQS